MLKNNFFLKSFILSVSIIFVILLYVFNIFSFEEYEINLNEGKNYIKFNIQEPFYVKDLIKLNPQIEYISFIENNKSIGFVNVFGGIGENFIITKNKTYEIFVNKDTKLFLPKK